MAVGTDWVAVIVEDDPDVRDLIDIVLTQSGFRTVVTEDGPAGVEAVRTHNPLITTLDVNMPGMDGFAVAKRLREFSNTYLIMITALADEIDVVQGFEAGADDYLVKPFRPRELRARADSMLRRPRSRNDSPSGWADDDAAAAAVTAEAARQPGAEPAAPPVEESWAAAATRDLLATASRPVVPVAEEAAAPAPPASAPQPTYQPPAPQPTYAPPPQPTYQAPARPAHQAPPEPLQQQPNAPEAPPAPAPRHAAAVSEAGAPRPDGSWVRYKGLALNQESRAVSVNGASVDLSRAEFDLLASLLTTGRRVRSKADLVLAMRGQQYVTSYFVNEADKRSVEVHIHNLRRKLGDDGATPRYIETVRGVGYRLAELV
jgi:two-component system OmpR family response regulator